MSYEEDLDILCKYIGMGSKALEVSIPVSLFLDPNIFENNPKKRMVLYIKSENENSVIPIRFANFAFAVLIMVYISAGEAFSNKVASVPNCLLSLINSQE